MMKASTRTSDATKTTTAVHTALVRVRIPPRSDELRDEISVAASDEGPGSVLCVSRSCESMAGVVTTTRSGGALAELEASLDLGAPKAKELPFLCLCLTSEAISVKDG